MLEWQVPLNNSKWRGNFLPENSTPTSPSLQWDSRASPSSICGERPTLQIGYFVRLSDMWIPLAICLLPKRKGFPKKNLFKLTYFLSFFPQRNFNPTKKGIYQILEYHETLRKLHKNYGPVVRQDIGRRTVIHAFDPDHVRSVLNADGKTPTVPPLQETTQIYREKRQLSPGLGNTYVTILSQYIFQLQ